MAADPIYGNGMVVFRPQAQKSWETLPLPAPAFPMDAVLSQATIVHVQETAKISNVIAHEMAACKNSPTESLANKLPAAGLRRHLKQVLQNLRPLKCLPFARVSGGTGL